MFLVAAFKLERGIHAASVLRDFSGRKNLWRVLKSQCSSDMNVALQHQNTPTRDVP